MSFLPDTGIALRLVNRKDMLYSVISEAIEKLESGGEEIVIVPQILIEFWTVATRPKNVRGFGMTTKQAARELEILQTTFRLLPENEQIFDEWKTLVTTYKVSGKTTHDARIVAAMRVHKIENILTLNPADFKRYASIKAITPQEVLAK